MKPSVAMSFAAAAIGAVCAVKSANAANVFFGEDKSANSFANMAASKAVRDAFVAQLGSYGTQSWEGYAAGTTWPAGGPVAFAGSSITGAVSTGLLRDVPFNGRFATSGSKYLDSSNNVRIDFSAPVTAFGLYVLDANENDNDPATVTQGGLTLTPEQIAARPFDSVDGRFWLVTERSPGSFEVLFEGGSFPANASGMFVGVIDAANPLTNVIFVNGAAGLDNPFNDGFGYEDLIVGSSVVPEPGTWALMALGLAGLGLAGRRARRRG